jgi:zinc protease
MRRLLIFLLLSLLMLTSTINAKVSEYTLNNGLKLLVKPDHRAPVAIFQIWYRVGGSYEPNGLTGISHALEHMMFEGTKHYPDETFSKVVSENGGQFNAFTTDDYTAYYEEFSANKIALSFKLEADRMQNATLSEAAFKKEIQVVMEERRMRYDDQPAMLLYERLRAAAFLSNPYQHTTIGWMGDLEQMTVQNVRDWYNAWYVPNNATIVVAGDVKPAAMLALAKKYFGQIPPGKLLSQKKAVYQKPLGERVVNVSLPAKIAYLYMAYNVPVLTTDKQSWQPYALDVLSAILAGSDSSRFTQNLIRGSQIAASAEVMYNTTSRLNNLFLISAVPAQGVTIANLQKALVKEINRVKTTLVSPDELARVKTQVTANKIYSEDSLDTQASDLGELMSVGLPWQLADDYVQHINKVTAEQVQAVAKLFLQKNRLTIAVLHPLPMSEADELKQQHATPASTGGIN